MTIAKKYIPSPAEFLALPREEQLRRVIGYLDGENERRDYAAYFDDAGKLVNLSRLENLRRVTAGPRWAGYVVCQEGELWLCATRAMGCDNYHIYDDRHAYPFYMGWESVPRTWERAKWCGSVAELYLDHELTIAGVLAGRGIAA